MRKIECFKAITVHAQVDAAALEELGFAVFSRTVEQLTPDDEVRLLVWSNEHQLTRDIVDLFPNLRGIVSWGTDDAHLKCRDHLASSNICHYAIDNYSTTAVAEFVVMSILTIARDFKNVLRGNRPYGSELSGRRIGIIGLGKIGLRIARIVADGFGCDVHYHSRRDKRIEGFKYQNDPYVLFDSCDFVVVTVKGSSFVLNPELLSPCGHSYLINITGERVLDISDATRLIKEGRIAGALYDIEVGKVAHLRYSDRLILTPKVAYRTHEANRSRQDLLLTYAQEVLNVM